MERHKRGKHYICITSDNFLYWFIFFERRFVIKNAWIFLYIIITLLKECLIKTLLLLLLNLIWHRRNCYKNRLMWTGNNICKQKGALTKQQELVLRADNACCCSLHTAYGMLHFVATAVFTTHNIENINVAIKAVMQWHIHRLGSQYQSGSLSIFISTQRL